MENQNDGLARKFKPIFGKEVTATEFMDECTAQLDALQDSDGQLHRSSVLGKRLVAFLHARDRQAFGGVGAVEVSIRVEGQYVDRVKISFATRAVAEDFHRQLSFLLSSQESK